MINASCHNLFTYCEPQCLSPSVKTQRRTQFSSGSHYRTTSEATSKRALNCRKSPRRPPIRVLQPFLQKHNRSIAQSLSHWLFNRRLRLLGHKKSDGHGLNRRVLLSQLEQCLGLRSGEACQQRMHLRLLLGQLLVSSRQPKDAANSPMSLAFSGIILSIGWIRHLPRVYSGNSGSSSGIRSCPPCESLPSSSWDSHL